jgi:hypothetical protein
MISLPYIGKGIGKTTVGSIENEIRKDKRAKYIISAVQVNNPSAIVFWHKMGYSIIGGLELQPDRIIVFYISKAII